MKKTAFYVLLTIVLLTYFVIRFPDLRYSVSKGITTPVDFTQDYISSQQLLLGKSLYPSNFEEVNKIFLQSLGSNPNPNIKFRNAHPPFVTMLLFPLSLLSFHNAIILYMLTTILSMLFIIFLLLKAESIPLIFFPFMALFIFAWPPFQANLYLGQISIIVTLFVVLGWYFLRRNREEMSGIFIALATMLKFYPALLIMYFLINKKYKAFLYSLISIAIILTLTLILTKHDFFHFISDIIPKDVKYWEADMTNCSMNGFFSKLFLPMKTYNDTTALTVLVSPIFKNIFFYITGSLLLLYSVLNIIKYNNDGLGFSLFLILSLLLSPLCWDHYLTLLLLPSIVLVKELVKRNNKYEKTIFIVSLLLLSVDDYSIYFKKVIYLAHLYLLGNSQNFFDTLTFYSLQFYGMLLLLILNFQIIKKPVKYTFQAK